MSVYTVSVADCAGIRIEKGADTFLALLAIVARLARTCATSDCIFAGNNDLADMGYDGLTEEQRDVVEYIVRRARRRRLAA